MTLHKQNYVIGTLQTNVLAPTTVGSRRQHLLPTPQFVLSAWIQAILKCVTYDVSHPTRFNYGTTSLVLLVQCGCRLLQWLDKNIEAHRTTGFVIVTLSSCLPGGLFYYIQIIFLNRDLNFVLEHRQYLCFQSGSFQLVKHWFLK